MKYRLKFQTILLSIIILKYNIIGKCVIGKNVKRLNWIYQIALYINLITNIIVYIKD